MTTRNRRPIPKIVRSAKAQLRRRTAAALAALGVVSLSTGCNFELAQVSDARSLLLPVSDNAIPSGSISSLATPTPKPIPLPTFTLTPSPTLSPTPAPTSTPTIPPSPTPWPTATPWPTPEPWRPAAFVAPTLASVPVVPTAVPAVVTGSVPVGYSPPHDVDVFGNVVLRWDFFGQLAEDEFFDVKIRPVDSNQSAFVDWTKTKSYELRPWSGWVPGLYTWQIGIIKGRLEGETKHFIADTGRDSQPFIIKWQAAGSGGGGGGNNGGGGGKSGGS